MNLLSDIITYVRRILKTQSSAEITDDLIIDYINRFWIMDVDARMQLFDLKTTYQFITQPGVDRYNMPLYDVQVEPGSSVSFYPVYQGFLEPCFINGIQCSFTTLKSQFDVAWPNYVQTLVQAGTGNGTNGPYTLSLPIKQAFSNSSNFPFTSGIVRGHVDISGIIATGVNQDPPIDSSGLGSQIPIIPTTSVSPAVFFSASDVTGANVIVTDSGVFSNDNVNLGLLMEPGKAPFGNKTLANNYVASFPITGATQAAQCVLTCTSQLGPGQPVLITGVNGMVELNDNTYTVVSNTGTLLTIDVDSTGFTPYISGGQVSISANTINYVTGVAQNVYFPAAIPSGMPINANCVFFELGLPRGILFYNNVITIRPPCNTQYTVSLTAYLTPAAFFSTSQSVPFAYMSEYIARGAARKILSDTGDWDQFDRYEPLFLEQESLVWKRAQRQFTATRTPTIYSQGPGGGSLWNNNFGLGIN